MKTLIFIIILIQVFLLPREANAEFHSFEQRLKMTNGQLLSAQHAATKTANIYSKKCNSQASKTVNYYDVKDCLQVIIYRDIAKSYQHSRSANHIGFKTPAEYLPTLSSGEHQILKNIIKENSLPLNAAELNK